MPRRVEHRHVLRGVAVQHGWLLRLLAIRRGHEGLDHSELGTGRRPRAVCQDNDRGSDLPHLRAAILRADGDHLEESQTVFRLEEAPRRIHDPYKHGDFHSVRGDRHSKSRPVHLVGRRRLPLHPRADVPICNRTGHRVGTGERTGSVLLEALEEPGDHRVRRVGFPNWDLREHPGDPRGTQMKRRVRRSCGATE